MSATLAIHEPQRDEQELISVLQSSLYPGAKRESILLVLAYCRANGIDPMLKPVHIVPTSIKLPNGGYETRDVLMPGIADYRIKASRSGEYGGKSEPEFGPDVTANLGGGDMTYPSWCRVTVRRIVQGKARDFPAVERWLENYATAKRDTTTPNTMWRKRPYGQLAKVAEAQALRMAFPEFSAGYTAEEMQGKTLDTFTGETIDSEPPADARDRLNAEIPLKAVAAPMPRGARIAEKAPAVEAPSLSWLDPLEETDPHRWELALDTVLANCQSRAEVEQAGAHHSVGTAIVKAPNGVRERVSKKLADAYGRFADDAEPEAELPEIKGEERLAAGDD